MQDAHSRPAVSEFRREVRRAAGRYRLERLAAASWTLSWVLSAALLALLLIALLTPLRLWALPLALVPFLGMGAAALIIYGRAVESHRLWSKMDAHAHLPDAVLSAGDWEGVGGDAWRERQRHETLAVLKTIPWTRAWPVTWPRLLWLPLSTCLLLLIALGLAQRAGWTQARAAALAEARANPKLTPEQVKPLEQVFRDWEAAQKIAPSPELADLLKKLQPMRAQMAAGQMTQKQLFLKLNDLQARLAAKREQVAAMSMEPLAQPIAEAVKNLDGMSGLAAALQRKDFAAAREQAAKAEQHYQSKAAQMPTGANAETAGEKLSQAAAQAANNPEAAGALSQMQNGVKHQDSANLATGLGGLKNALGQESQRQSQSHNLGLQLAQLGNCKGGMCQGAGIQTGLPQLSLAKSMQQQKGAGSDTDPNRAGAPTQIDASHQAMNLSGIAGQGASETQTENSNDPHLERTASSVNAAEFSAYERLSEQAATDENLPIADRQVIKRYFEDIRPSENR